MLNLWCAEGMRSVKLAEVQRLRFLNPVMDSEFKQGAGDAGAVARHAEEGGQHQFQRRGQARRCGSATSSRTRSGRPAIAWCSDKEGKPYLQGWAVVENPTDEDWKDVAHGAGLAAGRSPSRWTCTSRCTSRGRWSSPNCSPPSGRRPTTAAMAQATHGGGAARRGDSAGRQAMQAAAGTAARRSQADATDEIRRLEDTDCTRAPASWQPAKLATLDLQQGVQSAAPPASWATSSSTRSTAGDPAAAEVGPAAHRRQGRRGHRVSIYNESDARQVPAAGPEVQEHHRPAPHAGPHHRLRRHRLRRRRPHPRPPAQRGAAALLRHRPGHRGRSRSVRTPSIASPRSRSKGIIQTTHLIQRDEDLQRQEPLRARPRCCWSSTRTGPTSTW